MAWTPEKSDVYTSIDVEWWSLPDQRGSSVYSEASGETNDFGKSVR